MTKNYKLLIIVSFIGFLASSEVWAVTREVLSPEDAQKVQLYGFTKKSSETVPLVREIDRALAKINDDGLRQEAISYLSEVTSMLEKLGTIQAFEFIQGIVDPEIRAMALTIPKRGLSSWLDGVIIKALASMDGIRDPNLKRRALEKVWLESESKDTVASCYCVLDQIGDRSLQAEALNLVTRQEEDFPAIHPQVREDTAITYLTLDKLKPEYRVVAHAAILADPSYQEALNEEKIWYQKIAMFHRKNIAKFFELMAEISDSILKAGAFEKVKVINPVDGTYYDRLKDYVGAVRGIDAISDAGFRTKAFDDLNAMDTADEEYPNNFGNFLHSLDQQQRAERAAQQQGQ